MYFHTPSNKSQTSTNLTWESAANDFGLQVYAVKSPAEFAEIVSPDYKVKDAFFLVKDRAGNTLLSSSIFRNVYDNEKWNLSLTLKPKKYPFSDGVLGSEVGSSGYELALYGVNYNSGKKENYFNVSTNLTYASGSSIINSTKRVYIGAHKTNFTGSTLTSTDVRASSTRYWTDYLSPSVVDLQAKQVDTHGSPPSEILICFKLLALVCIYRPYKP